MDSALTEQAEEQANQLLSYLKSRQEIALFKRHRQLVVLAGDQTWVRPLLVRLLPALNDWPSLWISDNDSFPTTDGQCLSAKKLKHYLGTECQQLVWDGFSGLHPEGLGIAAGLLKAGGLQFVCLPPLDQLERQPDPDYLRMCGSDQELKACGTHFLQHLVRSFQRHPQLIVIEQSNFKVPTQIEQSDKRLNNRASNSINQDTFKLTDDQCKAIEKIKHTAEGRAHRPLIIKANRGRGKSTALGIAAAEIVTEQSKRIMITGPSPAACRIALNQYKALNDKEDDFSFVAVDDILQNCHQVDVLFVDEAASIPAPLLERLLKAYPRIVFSTTVHGYEGSGRGFAIKFQSRLTELAPQWKGIELHQPTRWNEGDPLEQWIFDALLLDAEPTDVTIPVQGNSLRFVSIERRKLIEDIPLFKQVVGLLVNAHYQTSPSDTRMILDHPQVSLLLAMSNAQVLGVVLSIAEGGVQNSELSQAIIEGRRKPKNHLVPQALTFCSADTDLMMLKTWRIMRIAVHQDCQRQGIASDLLRELEIHARAKGVDYLSSSFGFTDELLDFWEANQYQLIRVGRHKDAASGSESIIVTRPLTKNAHTILGQIRRYCAFDFRFSLSRHHQSMPPAAANRISSSLPAGGEYLIPQTIVNAYASAHRVYEESAFAIHDCLSQVDEHEMVDRLTEQERSALSAKVWQGLSWPEVVQTLGLTGKKQADRLLRQAITKLLIEKPA